MFLESAKITIEGVLPSFALGLVGFFLLKRNIIGEEGLDALGRLVIDVTLPLLIFGRLVAGFDFRAYPHWWALPLLSLAVTFAGFLAGLCFVGFVRGETKKAQFLSLIAFQNSGYLPLAMSASLLTGGQLTVMLIYLFLFLMGFNFLLFSFGVWCLTHKSGGKLPVKSFLNPPVIATLVGLACVLAGIGKFIPAPLTKAVAMAGDCTMPLAMFVVGGNIAAIKLLKVDTRAIPLMVLVKLILLPALGLALVYALKLNGPLGLLLVLQLAMPPATNLSVLARQYRQEDQLVSQGIFFGHVAGLVTIPVFLSIYFMLNMLK